MKKNNHYIDNKMFYEAIKNYLNDCKNTPFGKDEIPVTEYLGKCFFDLAKGISLKKQFSGNSFKDEMILDGVEDCLRSIKKFNPEKSKNPFSYFTTIITYAFLRRIKQEDRQKYLKYKSIQKAYNSDRYHRSKISMDLKNLYNHYFNFIDNYERKMKEKNEKYKSYTLSKKSEKTNTLVPFF